MKRSPFVGHGRKLAVEGLLAAFDQVASTRVPLWISLEAPSGTGKTRIVHEFYESLAALRQGEPPYWPDTILGDHPDAPAGLVQEVRKQVGPTVRHVPGSLPAFLWWGISAGSRSGARHFALETDVLTLHEHGPYIDDAWRRITSWNQRHADWWRSALAAGRDEVVTEVISEVMTAAVGVSIPGVGLLSELLKVVRTQRAEAIDRAERLVSSDLITTDSTLLVTEVIATVRRIALAGLPVVIFVEDLHATDETLADLLINLVKGEGSILVVTTSWGGAARANADLQNALERIPDRLITIARDPLRDAAPMPDGVTLSPLDSTDAQEIVRSAFPLVDQQTARNLVEAYPNPLALELFCSTRRLHRRFPDGRLALDDEEIRRLPATLNDLYRDLWRELPEVIRLELHLAALGAPITASGDFAEVRSWQRALILSAKERMFVRVRETGQAAAVRPDHSSLLRDWASTSGEDLWQFLEPTQFEVALSEPDLLTDGERQEFYEILAELLQEWIRGQHFARIPTRRYVTDLSAAMYAREMLDRADYDRALLKYLRVVEYSPEEAGGVVDVLSARCNVISDSTTEADQEVLGMLSWSFATALMRLGRYAEAESHLRRYAELGYPQTTRGRSERDLACVLLADCLTRYAPGEQRRNEAEELLEAVEGRLGSHHPEVLALAEHLDRSRDGANDRPSLLDRIQVGISGRPVFGFDDPPPYVVMNAIRHNPRHGDERSFVLIRQVGETRFRKELEMQAHEEYEVYTYFHNNAAPILNTAKHGSVGIVRGLKLSLDVPSVIRASERGKITSILTADNTSPRCVWNQIYATTRRTLRLSFVPGSARIVSAGPVDGKVLSSRLFSEEGAFLGWSRLNGILPGGIDFAGYVLYRLRAEPG